MSGEMSSAKTKISYNTWDWFCSACGRITSNHGMYKVAPVCLVVDAMRGIHAVESPECHAKNNGELICVYSVTHVKSSFIAKAGDAVTLFDGVETRSDRLKRGRGMVIAMTRNNTTALVQWEGLENKTEEHVTDALYVLEDDYEEYLLLKSRAKGVRDAHE